MSRDQLRFLFAGTAALAAMLLVGFLGSLEVAGDPKRPADAEGLAAWMAEHPADWLAASELADRSLDSTLPRRFEIWRGAHAIARHLAPGRENADAGFARAGLFHWSELSEVDRRAVLEAAPILLRDPRTFAPMAQSLWELTHDLPWLRRVSPRTFQNVPLLRDLAVANGRFADYRALRSESRLARLAVFQEARATAPLSHLLRLLPPKLDKEDEPLVRLLLQELENRPMEPDQIAVRAEDLAAYAVAHRVEPLRVLEPLVNMPGILQDETRARLVHALKNDGSAFPTPAIEPEDRKWSGTCSRDEVCTSASRTIEGPVSITVSVVQTDEVPPYLEIYVDDRLEAEGEVRDERTFAIPAGSGAHRIEVRLVNRLTRNGIQRRVRLS